MSTVRAVYATSLPSGERWGSPIRTTFIKAWMSKGSFCAEAMEIAARTNAAQRISDATLRGMVPANLTVGPVRGGERINTLDVVRGFALLGILLMNIPTFGFVQAAYANPNIQGGNDLLNR